MWLSCRHQCLMAACLVYTTTREKNAKKINREVCRQASTDRPAYHESYRNLGIRIEEGLSWQFLQVQNSLLPKNISNSLYLVPKYLSKSSKFQASYGRLLYQVVASSNGRTSNFALRFDGQHFQKITEQYVWIPFIFHSFHLRHTRFLGTRKLFSLSAYSAFT